MDDPLEPLESPSKLWGYATTDWSPVPDAKVIDLTKFIRDNAVLDDDMEDLISELCDADLVTDDRPDGLTITAFGARAAVLLLHHVIEYAGKQGWPMREPADVGAAATGLRDAMNPQDGA